MPAEKPAEGELMLETSPWVDIYSDSGFVDTTPIKKPLHFREGLVTLKLTNPAYPAYILRTSVRKDRMNTVRLNMDTLFGKLDCKILPWGEVYINGTKRGVTPLKSPIILAPGECTLTLKHPDFEDFSTKIAVTRNAMTSIKHNFTAR